MPKLREIATAIRSKNAGPYVLSVDIMLPDAPSYRRVLAANVLEPRKLSELYHVPAEQIQVIEYRKALAVKIAMPRPSPSGSFEDTDVLGAQQHAPLLDLEIS